MKSWMTNRCRRPRVGGVQLLTTALQAQPLPLSSSSGYYFEDSSAKKAVLDPLNNSSTSLTPEEAEGKSTTNFDSVSKPETLPSGTTPAYHFSSSTAPSSSGQLWN